MNTPDLDRIYEFAADLQWNGTSDQREVGDLIKELLSERRIACKTAHCGYKYTLGTEPYKRRGDKCKKR